MSGFSLSCKAEIAKALSLRLIVGVAITTVFGTILFAWGLATLVHRAYVNGRPGDVAGLEVDTAYSVALQYGQLGIVLFGGLILFQETEGGVLRTSLLAVPERSSLFAGKMATVSLGSFVIAIPAAVGATLSKCASGQCRSTEDIIELLSQDSRVLVGVILYWTLLGGISMALSTLLRNAIVAVATITAFVLAVSQYLMSVTSLARFLPDQAGAQMYQNTPRILSDLGPQIGLSVVLSWLLCFAVFGFVSIKTWQNPKVN